MPNSPLQILNEKSVLLVNFEHKDATLLLQHLQTFNFNENHAKSLAQGINFLQAKQYDLVICFGQSNSEPYILDLLKKIRGSASTIKLPVVIISENVTPNTINKFVALGVSDYIVTPIIQSHLAKRLQHAIEFPIRSNSHALAGGELHKVWDINTNIEEISLLVVDDVATNIEVIVGALKTNYKIKAANNATSAMSVCISNSPPDIVLLDIMMPNIDGLTFCKQLKSNPITQDIRVIFTTALGDVDDVVRGLELGAVDYLTKPIIPAILNARVKVHAQIIIQHRLLQQQIDSLISLSNKL
ncbi:response regulator [Thalassomonas sp. M1454]|uniref:response regulator n=1 Tax=Thalassomonas sp. M1454 TaxID=2594477 RepID=UPI00117F5099|nr:response regulator [Thalassomonas sp. M1454]TRX57291.1 response regulator [Thalassomonas sp. M1454]